MNAVWQFDHTVALTFVEHARKHIPNYDIVIDKCITLCDKFLSKDSAIIDVGCATGETLKRLNQQGFTNLTGVDSSQPMLDQCKVPARLICSHEFPSILFDAVLCNWTLHFIRNKLDYLHEIYNHLTPDGMLVISDKTNLDPAMIDLYHKFKSNAGVSDNEILNKAASIKDIMFINSLQWYIDTLSNIGFKNIQIIDASWCFTTILCRKTTG